MSLVCMCHKISFPSILIKISICGGNLIIFSILKSNVRKQFKYFKPPQNENSLIRFF